MTRRLALMLLVLSLTACQGLETRSDERRLEVALSTYATATRWQPLETLYGYLAPGVEPATPPPGLDNVRITGYEVVGAPRELAPGKVMQSVRIEYVLVDRQQVKQLVDNQLWERDADGSWLRANPIPAFR